jgi:predicted transcriptional regulator
MAPKWCHNGAAMNITLKNVPDTLHRRLRKLAEQSGRSLNKMILFTLEQSVQPRRTDRAALVGRIQKRRNRMDAWLKDKILLSAIQEGRR